MKTYNNNPNFSIVVPGGCNALCPFCFYEPPKTEIKSGEWLAKLKESLTKLPDNFQQISITGGEPTKSAFFWPLIDLLASFKRKNINKVVLTTNGQYLWDRIEDPVNAESFAEVIDHVNISRHAPTFEENVKIFGNTKCIPDDAKLQKICLTLNTMGIDVTLNCVLESWVKTRDQAARFIVWARGIGASAVCFRKPHGTLMPTSVEKSFSAFKSVGEGECPVCRTKSQIIGGMTVTWKASKKEPSKDLKSIYELIFHDDGKLTADWSKEIPVKLENAGGLGGGKSVQHQDAEYEGCGSWVRRKKAPHPCETQAKKSCGSGSDASCSFKNKKGGCGSGGCGHSSASGCGSSGCG